jgi:hypothetical protein
MESLNLFFSTSGRLAPKPFALGVCGVYLASFLSHGLLSPRFAASGGFLLFVAVQAAVTWAWFALHAKRRRDAGRGAGIAAAFAILYALAIILLLLIVSLLKGDGTPSDASPAAALAGFFLLFYLLAVYAGNPEPLGVFGIIVFGTAALIFTPMVITMLFTVLTGIRRSAPTAP